MLGVESCTVVFLGGHFLVICSDTFAVGSIVLPQYKALQTDGQHYSGNSRSYCVQLQCDRLIILLLLIVFYPGDVPDLCYFGLCL